MDYDIGGYPDYRHNAVNAQLNGWIYSQPVKEGLTTFTMSESDRDNGSMWFKQKARFYTPIVNNPNYKQRFIDWIDDGGRRANYLHACAGGGGFTYIKQACTDPHIDYSQGNHNDVTRLPDYIDYRNGTDQRVNLSEVVTRGTKYRSSTYLFFQETQGDRSLFVNWFYHTSDDKWKDPSKVGYGGRSVYNALDDLVKSQNQSNDVKIEVNGFTERCTPPECTKTELYQLQNKLLRNYGAATVSHQRFNDAVFIMHKDDGYGLNSGVVFSWGSFAFVFPVVSTYNQNDHDNHTIRTIAHELGHTLGFNHINGGCTKADNWDCPSGYLMSYNSGNPNMHFSDESKVWFKKAPWHWVHPRFGFTLKWAANEEIKPTQIINW